MRKTEEIEKYLSFYKKFGRLIMDKTQRFVFECLLDYITQTGEVRFSDREITEYIEPSKVQEPIKPITEQFQWKKVRKERNDISTKILPFLEKCWIIMPGSDTVKN